MTKRKKVEITMINEHDGYAECDEEDVPAVLEMLTGNKLLRVKKVITGKEDVVPRSWYLDAMDQVAKLQAEVAKLKGKKKTCENCNSGPRPTPFHHWCESCTKYDKGVLSPKVDRWEAKKK